MPFLETEPGVRLHLTDAGSGTPVVLVHGWSLSSRAFALQSSLAAVHRVVAVDLRGHGRSSASASGWSLAHHARDLERVFRALKLSGAVLVGWSMGGQIALAAAPALLDRLAGLVLLSSTPRFTAGPDWPHGLPEASVCALAARLERSPEKALRRFFDGMFAAGEVNEAGRAELARVAGGPAPSLEAARGGLEALLSSDARGSLESVRAPALVLHGELDPLCPPGAALHLARALPTARLHLLPGVGHAPQLSRPGEVNELLLRFASELA